jgi:hypothetical protein
VSVNGRPTIAWTPWGRKVTTSLLYRHLARDHRRGIVDAWYLYMNTDPDQVGDVAYAHELAASHDWIHLVHRPADVPVLSPKQRMTGFAYRYFTNADAVYVRLDDDIIYIHEDAITTLVNAKLQQESVLCAFPMTWNNAIVSHFAQQYGKIPRDWGTVGMYCMDPIGWANGQFGIRIHNLLLEKIEQGRVGDLYLYQDVPLPPATQFSVSCFATAGSDYAILQPPGFLGYSNDAYGWAEEENFHTIEWPRRTGKVNMLIGNALVSHYTFGPQRQEILATDILDRYRAIAEAQ